MLTITAKEIHRLRATGHIAYVYPRIRKCCVDGGPLRDIVGLLPAPVNA